MKRVTKGFNSKSQCNARTYTYTLPTFAFAPDDPSIISRIPSEEDIEARVKELSIIDGKPFTKFRMSPELLDKVNSVFKLYEGTHNFHNFTAKVYVIVRSNFKNFDISIDNYLNLKNFCYLHV